jgi:hypothetical protein
MSTNSNEATAPATMNDDDPRLSLIDDVLGLLVFCWSEEEGRHWKIAKWNPRYYEYVLYWYCTYE